MTRMVQCVKLGREAPGLEAAPMKGELGRRIYDNVSQEGWKLWLQHSTMVINEYRLDPSKPEHQVKMMEQLENFFFGAGVEAPPDYVPEGQEPSQG